MKKKAPECIASQTLKLISTAADCTGCCCNLGERRLQKRCLIWWLLVSAQVQKCFHMEATKNGGTPKTEFPILFYYFAILLSNIDYLKSMTKKRERKEWYD